MQQIFSTPVSLNSAAAKNIRLSNGGGGGGGRGGAGLSYLPIQLGGGWPYVATHP